MIAQMVVMVMEFVSSYLDKVSLSGAQSGFLDYSSKAVIVELGNTFTSFLVGDEIPSPNFYFC